MKIGILTYHRTHNYGGCLQALATRLLLESKGHEAYYVDYWPDYHKRAYSIFNKDEFALYNWKGKVVYVLSKIKVFPYARKRQRLFELFHHEYTIPYCRPQDEQYDVILYGSDQIWRKQKALNDYNPIYFGVNDFQAKKHVAYAASMGLLPQTTEEDQKLATMLKRFDGISVREDSLKDYLLGIGVSDVAQAVDPTLLVDANIWDRLLTNRQYDGKKYILVYALWGDVFDMNSVRALAKKENLIIKTLRGETKSKESETEISLADPIDFLNLIKNAEYVFTSSFHGLAFSLLYHKQVFASFKINGGRAQSLLNSVGIPERYLTNYQPFLPDIMPIDFDKVDIRLQSLRKASIDFLAKMNIF